MGTTDALCDRKVKLVIMHEEVTTEHPMRFLPEVLLKQLKVIITACRFILWGMLSMNRNNQ